MYGTVRTVVWEGGRRKAPSYPIGTFRPRGSGGWAPIPILADLLPVLADPPCQRAGRLQHECPLQPVAELGRVDPVNADEDGRPAAVMVGLEIDVRRRLDQHLLFLDGHITTTVSASLTRHRNFLLTVSDGVPYEVASTISGRPAAADRSFSKAGWQRGLTGGFRQAAKRSASAP